MPFYRLASEQFYFPYAIPELEPFEINKVSSFVPYLSDEDERDFLLTSRVVGFVGGKDRLVEVWSAPAGILLKVEGGSDLYIARDGRTVCKSDYSTSTMRQPDLQQLDRDIILGPALVLALALRNVWSLHASAALYKENAIAFLGESEQGKSTLAAYLSQSADWRLIADDILPVRIDANGVNVLPHFPQLKLPMNAQPAVDLPERLPLKYICVLAHAGSDQMPELQEISTAQAVRSLLGHIAGARMFGASLLAKHLEFSTQAAKRIPAYRLNYPHRRDTLPLVQEFLEKIC